MRLHARKTPGAMQGDVRRKPRGTPSLMLLQSGGKDSGERRDTHVSGQALRSVGHDGTVAAA